MKNGRKPKNQKKTNVITIKCSDIEKEQFLKMAEEKGMSLSNYICSAASTRKTVAGEINRKIAVELIELRELSNSLKNIVELAEEIDGLCDKVIDVTKENR